MSRYVIEENERREVVVGWDDPMGTFFAQIFVPEKPGLGKEEELLWWIGCRMREVTTIEGLELALEEQGIELTAGQRSQLVADEAAPWEPGPLQRSLGFTGKAPVGVAPPSERLSIEKETRKLLE